MLYNPLAKIREKIMVPSRFHAPLPFDGPTSQITWGTPPEISIFLSLDWAKNPIERLSGDQNIASAPSVPTKGRASKEPSARSQRSSLPSLVLRRKATYRPSGEI